MTAEADDENTTEAPDAEHASADSSPTHTSSTDQGSAAPDADGLSTPDPTAETPTPEVATAATTSIAPAAGSADDSTSRPRRRWLLTGAIAVGAFVFGGLVGGAIGHRSSDRDDRRSDARPPGQVREGEREASDTPAPSDADKPPRDQRGNGDHRGPQGRPGGRDGQHREGRSQHD